MLEACDSVSGAMAYFLATVKTHFKANTFSQINYSRVVF